MTLRNNFESGLMAQDCHINAYGPGVGRVIEKLCVKIHVRLIPAYSSPVRSRNYESDSVKCVQIDVTIELSGRLNKS